MNQSEVKPKLLVTQPQLFFRSFRQLHAFASSFDWFIELFELSVIDQSEYFSFGFTRIN